MGSYRPDRRRRRHEAIARAGRPQGNVLSRRQLYANGLTRGEVRAEIGAGRWKRLGAQTVLVGAADGTTPWWRAVLEVGPTAVLDGVTALQAAGLRTLSDDVIHVAVPKSSTPRRCRGVRVHETRRYRVQDIAAGGVPRMRPATAAVHAALWARSDRQAALILVAAAQQKLASVTELAEAIELVRRHPRRRLLRGLLIDVGDGVESLGEGDFAAACRRRGFPKPDQQVVRTLPSGRLRYDSVWRRYNTEAEIDGVQHLDAAEATRDALKQNAAALSGAVVIRIPNYAFRADPEPFLDQIEAALRAGGWTPELRPAQRSSRRPHRRTQAG